MSEPVNCPRCQALLVHDTFEAYNRCLGCGWYAPRKIGHDRDQSTPGFIQQQAQAPGSAQWPEELQRMVRAAPVALSALQGALAYIGDNDGECEVCGGDNKRVPYSKECPCYLIRKALAIMEGKEFPDVGEEPDDSEEEDPVEP